MPAAQPSGAAPIESNDVADLVRNVRLAAGLTQAELARRAETTQSMVARYESGAVSPTIRALGRLVSACGQELLLATTAEPDRKYGTGPVAAPPGISDYLNRPDSGWIPGRATKGR